MEITLWANNYYGSFSVPARFGQGFFMWKVVQRRLAQSMWRYFSEKGAGRGDIGQFHGWTWTPSSPDSHQQIPPLLGAIRYDTPCPYAQMLARALPSRNSSLSTAAEWDLVTRVKGFQWGWSGHRGNWANLKHSGKSTESSGWARLWKKESLTPAGMR